MHHETTRSEEMRKLRDEITEKTLAASRQDPGNPVPPEGLGPTGEFPEGQLTENDEGEIAIAVTAYKGKVVINFGTPVASLGFSPNQARELARSIRK